MRLGAALSRASVALPVLMSLCGMAACEKASRPGGPASASGSSLESDLAGTESAPEPMGAREAAMWAAATAAAEAGAGDTEELVRLVDLVGCQGVRERASRTELRTIAIRAMQHCEDFSELPWLVQVATGAGEAEARAALESIDELAARPRRATDPDDAEELRAGCNALLALARAKAMPRARRVLAIRGLRMLSERGCVKRAEIPTDLDPG